MKIKSQLLTILAIFALVFPIMILAESLPPIPPLLVWGNVSIDGQPAPLDTEISAEINELEVAVGTMVKEGVYVIGIPDGKANEGKMVTFKVNGIVNASQLQSVNIDTTPSVKFDLAVVTTRACPISNGQGIQTWNDSNGSWGDCLVEFCNSGYHQSGNSCVIDSSGEGSSGGGGGGGGGVTTPSTPTSPLSETAQKVDANKDGKIDVLDFNTLMVNWGSASAGNVADFNGDGKVDVFDFNLLMINWTL